MASLTTTSYAILGLLSARPYTAYELAEQSGRSLRFAWPTAASRLYAEPKRLAAEGLIEVDEEPAGPTRTRQVFRITAAGRDALRAWMATEPAPPKAEFEFLLRVLVGDAGDTDDLARALRATREQAQLSYDEGRELMRDYQTSGVQFPERMHLNMLWIVFVRDLLQLIIDWSAFAEAELAGEGDPKAMGETPRAHELLDAMVEERSVLPARGQA